MITMVKFTISGRIKLGKEKRIFTKEIEGKSENDAKEKVYALFGSYNKVKRVNVIIEKVEKQ